MPVTLEIMQNLSITRRYIFPDLRFFGKLLNALRLERILKDLQKKTRSGWKITPSTWGLKTAWAASAGVNGLTG